MRSSSTKGSKTLLTMMLLCALTLPMAGCATMMGSSERVDSGLTAAQRDSICSLWPTVSWADADTDQTITDVKINNARHKGFCT